MVIKIVPNDRGNPPGKLADAERAIRKAMRDFNNATAKANATCRDVERRAEKAADAALACAKKAELASEVRRFDKLEETARDLMWQASELQACRLTFQDLTG